MGLRRGGPRDAVPSRAVPAAGVRRALQVGARLRGAELRRAGAVPAPSRRREEGELRKEEIPAKGSGEPPLSTAPRAVFPRHCSVRLGGSRCGAAGLSLA